eukprot:scaffold306499_cov23-Tisochrysis_lutea.AAC.2
MHMNDRHASPTDRAGRQQPGFGWALTELLTPLLARDRVSSLSASGAEALGNDGSRIGQPPLAECDK